jgi:DHA1 family tetracycline resistance protein-like MFS transporter
MLFPKFRLTDPARAGRAAGLVFIAITVCLDVLAQSITFPILPRLAQQLLDGDRAAAARWVGFLEVAWVVPQFFAAPVLGMLSDRFGRRPVIVLSVLGVGLEFVLCALAPSIGWLLLGRVLCGLSCGAQAAAMAYVADVTPPERRARSYGWLNAAMWAGVILGPALGGLLGAIDLRAPFWAAGAVALVGGVYGFLVLPESLRPADRAPIRWSKAHPWGALDMVRRIPGLPMLGAVFLLLWFARYALDSVFVLYTANRYGWASLTLGLFFSVVACVNIVVQTGLSGRIAGWLGERRAVIIGLIFQTAGFALAGLSPTGAWFCAAMVPIAFGNIAGPSLQALMTAKVAPDQQGRLQGAMGSIGGLTGLAGPIAFTQIFAWSIGLGRGPAWSGATILVGAGISLLAWALVVFSGRQASATALRTASPPP